VKKAMRFKSQEGANEFQRQIIEAARRWTRPIWWYDSQHPFERLKITGASFFVLKSRAKYIGITAAHVIQGIVESRQRTPALHCRIGHMPLYVPMVITDMDEDLDIATFALSEGQVKELEVQSFDISLRWPSPTDLVAKKMPIVLSGFPECFWVIDNEKDLVGPAPYIALALVEDYYEDKIIVKYDPLECDGLPNLLPLGFNLSGCSGGPAVILRRLTGAHQCYPVGLIYEGPRGESEGDAAKSDLIFIRRIDCIDEEGRIVRENEGWLPR
jgi:hypothetical protein